MGDINEAIEVLTAGGVIDRLKSDQQAGREAERAGLLVRLAKAEGDAAVRDAAMAHVRPALQARIDALEADLAAARLELQQQCGEFDVTPFTLDKLRSKLRKLADPRIAQAIMRLHELDDRARAAFMSREVRRKKLTGGYTFETESNALEISDVLAKIRPLVKELEELQTAERPGNLEALLEEKISPIKQAVQKLAGLA